MVGEERLAALLCARLCHDMAGPVGAVSAGAELLGDTASGMDQEAIGLIAENARSLTERLKFYRLAFGTDGGGEADPAALRNLAANFARAPSTNVPFELDWRMEKLEDRRSERLLVNLLLLAAGSLTRGGTLRVSGGGRTMRIEAAGPSLRLGEETQAALRLESPPDGLTPRTVQPYLTAMLARAGQLRASATANADSVCFAIETCLD